MSDYFEIIDLKSGNLAGDYERAEDALAALRNAAHRHGWGTIAKFSLIRIHGEDQEPVAMNDELVRLVRAFSDQPEGLATIPAGSSAR